MDGDDAGAERPDERVWTGAAAVGREDRAHAEARVFAGRPKIEDALARSEQKRRRLGRVVLLRKLRDGRRNIDARRDDEARRRRIGRRSDLGFQGLGFHDAGPRQRSAEARNAAGRIPLD